MAKVRTAFGNYFTTLFNGLRNCRMFNQQEMQILIGGVDTAIDIEDLKKNTVYSGLYNEEEPTIQMFWRVSEITITPGR